MFSVPFLLFSLLLVLQRGITADDSVRTDIDPADKCLVTAKNQTGGVLVQLRIFPGLNTSTELSSYKQKDVTGHFLSPECGEAFQRCSRLQVEEVVISATTETKETSGGSIVVILPLVKELGLQKVKSDGAGSLSFSGEPHIIDFESRYDCSPSANYRIGNYYYVVCSNAETSSIQLLRVKLNATHLEESTVSALEHLRRASVPNLTNTLHVDLPSQSGSYIFFASRYNIFYFRPLDYLIGELSVGLQEEHCSATALDYVGGWDMIVYCEDNRAVYVDINREFIPVTVQYSQYGRPYVCPNPDVYLGVRTDIQTQFVIYGSRDTGEATDFFLSTRNFENGICLESESNTLFAFTDRDNGTRLLNTSGSTVQLLSDTACTDYPCQPLVVLQDRYLVIREKKGGIWNILLFDSHNNFSLARKVARSDADMMALVSVVKTNKANNDKKVTTVAPLTNGSENRNTATPQTAKETPNVVIERQASDGTNEAVIPTVVPIAVVVFISLIAVASTIVGIVYCKRKKPAKKAITTNAVPETAVPPELEADKEPGPQPQPTPEHTLKNSNADFKVTPFTATSAMQEDHVLAGELRGDDQMAGPPSMPLNDDRARLEVVKHSELANA